MTVAGSAAALTKAINDTTKELDITEASLDAKVTAVQASEAAAGADKTEAEGYRDEAAAHAVSVAGDLTTVQGNVTYQGISAILAEKAVTAVDVFVYDTSRDSDGGAWRKRCQHTSWYNEPLNTATRGARREFPTVAVIVADLNNLTIYDGDDPALPMWMVFERTTIACWLDGAQNLSCVTAKNGIVALGSSYDEANRGGLRLFNFVADSGEHFVALSQFYTGKYAGGIAQRQTTGRSYSGSGKLIADDVVNDVAMTVLPDAPTDPATGLPVPTIAVATAGGVSVIRDDGTVVSPYTAAVLDSATFIDDGNLWCVAKSWFYGAICFQPPLYSSETGRLYTITQQASAFPSFPGVGAFLQKAAALNGRDMAFSSVNAGLHRFDLGGLAFSALAKLPSGAVARITTGFNTGWMPGDIKGAFLSNTDDTDLVGSGELVTNGTFDTDISGWTITANDGSNNTVVWDASGAANLLSDGSVAVALTLDGLSAQKQYWVSFDLTPTTGGVKIWDGNVYVPYTTSGTHTHVLRGSTSLQFYRNFGATDVLIDNVSLREVQDNDRSVNNKGLIVNGTVTRTPVATGADLVAYSGFSASNYLSQPHNADLDFGTGDFCVMGWVKQNSTATAQIAHRADIAGVGGGVLSVWNSSVLGLSLDISDDNLATKDTVNEGSQSPTGVWRHAAFVRRGPNILCYINGVLKNTKAVSNATGGLNNSTAVLRVGLAAAGGYPLNGSLALWRISATAPTPDQIAKIYKDERKLFMPGAQCTLYGTSDAVTALAHDPKTNLLHVGTSAGRSVFDGLQRLAHTETPVITAISAASGLIVEE